LHDITVNTLASKIRYLGKVLDVDIDIALPRDRGEHPRWRI